MPPLTGPGEIQRGQRIPASWLNQIAAAVVRCITGGRGIKVNHMTGRVIIESTQHPVHAGGGGITWYTATVVGNLPTDIDAPALGYTTSDKLCWIFDGNLSTWQKITEFYAAATFGALPSVTAPALGYVTGTGNYYVRVGAAWLKITLEGDYIPLSTTITSGPAFKMVGDQLWLRNNGGDWICISHLEDS